jgi:hypothetical protein
MSGKLSISCLFVSLRKSVLRSGILVWQPLHSVVLCVRSVRCSFLYKERLPNRFYSISEQCLCRWGILVIRSRQTANLNQLTSRGVFLPLAHLNIRLDMNHHQRRYLALARNHLSNGILSMITPNLWNAAISCIIKKFWTD